MKFLIAIGVLIFLVAGCHCEIIVTVDVTVKTITASPGDSVTIPCEYTQNSSVPTLNPVAYWIKGKSVDDLDAIIIFAEKKLNDSYVGKADVNLVGKPYLTLYNVNANDEGRYWCMITEWSARGQVGTDADSAALSVSVTKPSLVITTQEAVAVQEGYMATMTCTPSGSGTWDTVTWYQGPFHDTADDGYIGYEIGHYKKLGSYYTYYHCNLVSCSAGQQIEPDYVGKIGITTSMLIIYATIKENQGRYWCEASYSASSYEEFETNRHSTRLIINSPEFDCSTVPQGSYADPNDCSMYYECVGDPPTEHHRPCPDPSLVFNPDTGVCDWANNVPPPCGTKV